MQSGSGAWMRSLIGLVLSAVILASLQTRYLWEYWVRPPASLASDACAGGPVRWAVVGVDDEPLDPRVHVPSALDSELAQEACRRGPGECGRTNVEIAAVQCSGGTMPALLDQDRAMELWRTVRESDDYGRLWRDVEPAWRGTYATVVLFGEGGNERAVVAASGAVHPTRVGDDTYRFAEWLLAQTDQGLRVVAAHTYRFDVAGVEFLTWPVLFVVDVVLLVILWGVAQVVRALCSVVVGALKKSSQAH